MLYIPADQLRPGMVLARDLPSDFFGLALAAVGHALSARNIIRIVELGIPGAYVESNIDIELDISHQDVLSPAVQKKLITGIRQQFTAYASHGGTVSDQTIEAFYSMSSEMVTNILSKEHVLLNMVSIKRYDDYTYSHSAMVGLISTLIGTKLGMKTSELESLATAGLMHDIGKLDVPIEITNKPARLTREEFEIMKTHPSNAVLRLRENRRFNMVVLRGIECHHEKYDGTGYPHALSGESIPLFGRILALADVYDALTSKRSYRDSWTSDQVIEYMMGLAGIHFDFDLLNAFLTVVSAYPIGSVVELSNGDVGVVVANTPGMTLRPRVQVLTPQEKQGVRLDLACDSNCLSITVVRTITDMSGLPSDIFKIAQTA